MAANRSTRFADSQGILRSLFDQGKHRLRAAPGTDQARESLNRRRQTFATRAPFGSARFAPGIVPRNGTPERFGAAAPDGTLLAPQEANTTAHRRSGFY